MTSGSGLSGEFNGRAPVAGAAPALDADALLVRGNARELGLYANFARGNDGANAGVRLGASAGNNQTPEQREAEKRKKENEERMFQILLDDLRERSAQLGREIASLENRFAQQYGDAWREHMANQILDPDIIPQREDGESMEDYRTRLEKTLIAEMLNEDGTIKDKYQTGEYAQWAVWAQNTYDKDYIDQKVEILSDPNVSEEVKIKELSELEDNGTLSQLNRADAVLDANGNNVQSLEDAARKQAASATQVNLSPSDLSNF